MEISKNINYGVLEVKLTGKFTFSDHLPFRDVLIEFADKDISKVILHMAGLTFIDSAAIGMLLLVHDEAQKQNKEAVLLGVTGQVKKMIELAKLNTLFIVR